MCGLFALLNFCCATFKYSLMDLCLERNLEQRRADKRGSDREHDGAVLCYVFAADEADIPHLLKECPQQTVPLVQLSLSEITTAKGCCLW